MIYNAKYNFFSFNTQFLFFLHQKSFNELLYTIKQFNLTQKYLISAKKGANPRFFTVWQFDLKNYLF